VSLENARILEGVIPVLSILVAEGGIGLEAVEVPTNLLGGIEGPRFVVVVVLYILAAVWVDSFAPRFLLFEVAATACCAEDMF
jgi:hypothetical protein